MRMPRLTKRRLDAIIEALASRLAEAIEEDEDCPTREEYEAALAWAQWRRDVYARVEAERKVGR